MVVCPRSSASSYPLADLSPPSSHEFLRRSEVAFRSLHERVLYLEQRQDWQGPSDEQVERVLRKILAERFSDAQVRPLDNPNRLKDGDYFVKPPDGSTSIPRAPSVDPALLVVDPEAVPSKAYGQAFQMLENGLRDYPQVDLTRPAQNGTPTEEGSYKRPKLPCTSLRPWQS